jgi:hypothetical protein
LVGTLAEIKFSVRIFYIYIDKRTEKKIISNTPEGLTVAGEDESIFVDDAVYEKCGH